MIGAAARSPMNPGLAALAIERAEIERKVARHRRTIARRLQFGESWNAPAVWRERTALGKALAELAIACAVLVELEYEDDELEHVGGAL